MQPCSDSGSSNNCCQCCCPKRKKRKQIDCGCPPPGTRYCPPPVNIGDCVRPMPPPPKNVPANSCGDYGKPPPPPPGGEDQWDLQYCKWWGWNWVRRRPDPQMASPPCAPRQPEGGYCISVPYPCNHPKKKGCPCKSMCKKLFKGKGKNKCQVYYGCGLPNCYRPQVAEPRYRECPYHMEPNYMQEEKVYDKICVCPPKKAEKIEKDCGCGPKNKGDSGSSYGAPSIQDDMERVSVKLHEKNNKTRRYICYPAAIGSPETPVKHLSPKHSRDTRHSGHTHSSKDPRHSDHSNKNLSRKASTESPKGSRDSLKKDSKHSRDTRLSRDSRHSRDREDNNRVSDHSVSHHSIDPKPSKEKNVHTYMLHELSNLYNPYFQNLCNSEKKFSKFGQPYTTFSWMGNFEKSFGGQNYKDEFRSPLTGKTYSLNLNKVGTQVSTSKLPDPINPGNITFTVSGNTKTQTNSLYDSLLCSILSPKVIVNETVFEESPRDLAAENSGVLEDVKTNLNRVDNLMQKLLDDNPIVESEMQPKKYTINSDKLNFTEVNENTDLISMSGISNISLKPCKRCLSEESVRIEPKKFKCNQSCVMEDVFHQFFHYFNVNHLANNIESMETTNSSVATVETTKYNIDTKKEPEYSNCVHTINSAITELVNNQHEHCKSDVSDKSGTTLKPKRSLIPVRKGKIK